jgi:hypothetical protein
LEPPRGLKVFTRCTIQAGDLGGEQFPQEGFRRTQGWTLANITHFINRPEAAE